MKSINTIIAAVVTALSLSTYANEMTQTMEAMSDLEMNASLDWHIGDTSEYRVSSFLGSGSMTKSVTKEEGNTVWVHQDMKTPGHNEVIDKQYDRATGNVLRMIRNGAEQNPQDSQLQVISQTEETVTVAAGTFKVIHIIGKTPKISKVEMWVNTTDTAIDGIVKMIMNTPMAAVTSELTGFKRN